MKAVAVDGVVERFPLNTLAISFGPTGLAGVWTAGERIGVPGWVGQVFWVIAAITWVWLILAHLIRGRRSSQTFMMQLRHPGQGPVVAVVPIVGMLIGADLYRFWQPGGAVLVLLSLAAATVVCVWMIRHWLSGELTPESVHGAYLVPTAAAGLIAATVSAEIGLPVLAVGAFGFGMLFWVVTLTLLIVRLAILPPLPPALVPTLAIMLAPPAIGGIAWFAIRGENSSDTLSRAFLGITLVMLLVELACVPKYRRLPFSLSFWAFSLPVAVTGVYCIQWLSLGRPWGWQAAAVVCLVVPSALVAAITAQSLNLLRRTRVPATVHHLSKA